MSTANGVVRCDQCLSPVKGDNTDSWAGLLPMPTVPPPEEEQKKNKKMKWPKYSITHADLCFPCKDALGDWLSSTRKVEE